jgi:hypothetical protein
MTMNMKGDEVLSDFHELLLPEDGEIWPVDEGLFTRVPKLHLRTWMEEDPRR